MKKLKIKKTYNFIKTYFIIAFGLFINALGWTAFLIPAKIVGGGVTGISTLIFFATDFPVGISVLLINSVLVLIAIKVLGAKFGVNSIFGIIVSAGCFMLLQHLITEPVVQEPFMATLLGGILAGTGIGIAFVNGGNSGGTDIIALIITKYRNITPGRVILYLDLAIIASSYLIFQSIEKIVYGYVMMAVTSYAIDMILEGAKQSYQIMIFSSQNRIIADRIANEIGRGVTLLNGIGWFTKQESEVLIVVARKYDKPKIMKIIAESDNKAFTSVAKVTGVYGLNFDTIKF